MSLLSGFSDFFGLDIGNSAMRLVQLKGGHPKSLFRYAIQPLEGKIALSDSNADQQKLAATIKEFIASSKISSRNVAVGLPSQRVFTTVFDTERLSQSELAKSIRFQADSLIPTPLLESKIDWVVLGDSPREREKIEVLLTSVPNTYIEKRLDLLESIGLNVIAFEPESIAVARSIVPEGTQGAVMVIDIGSIATDIVVVYNGSPRLVRSIPTGYESIIHAAVQNLNIDEKQAEQFIFKFGLSQDKLEGQIYNAIISTVDLLTTELEKSIKFFQTRYSTVKIDRIIVTGGASSLPEFPLHIANKFSVNVEIGNAWRNVSFPQSQQNELLAVSNQFGVAAGLAERSE